MKKEQRMAKEIVEQLGGPENVQSVTNCMTRLRVSVKDESLVNQQSLKSIEGVMGVVEDDTWQVIIGPGTVNIVRQEVDALLSSLGKSSFEEQAEEANINRKKKNQTPFKRFLRTLGNIFIPLIPGLVASGIINGVANFMINAGMQREEHTWLMVLTILGSGLFTYLAILVGWNTAKEFGGTPVLGAIAGMFIFNPALADVTIFGEALQPGRGGLFGVIFAAWLTTYFEKHIRKVIPASVDIIFTSLFTVLLVGFLSIYAIMPIAGILSDGITSGIQAILSIGGPIAGALMAGFFLPLVMVGLHHGLTPIHVELINVFSFTTLLPILAMAGAGQVGAAIAIFVKTRNKRLRNIIKGGLPVGFLGIGEPLLYGVTLPLGRPFITASLGAAVGGATQAMFGTGATGIGVSGLSLTPLIAEGKYLQYLFAIALAYLFGFIFTYAFGFKEEMAKNI
ncbi:PTS transporter subunit EIIC [Alkalicoccobacillus porphyridii]|uniref:PTS sugar transporter subunit IIC n=1 Tax=Alkalicoccobacillus porphyridii TaxID=2597270 RepID=A0A553ZW72_9BACI|nr:PTS transporter subunit EIIC [Alkalicoccobacillus porphyridii]TSB45707.1 PTS sugar transporter subunit IIC [Alkalicoccobacillus porphyridii]